jgi:ubiquinol-cytochrome c reductase cytochrome c subunit
MALALVLCGCEHKPAEKAHAVVDAAPPAAFDRAQAAETFTQNCQICHSLDLVRAQRLGRAAWEKEVKKMIGWGAPLPAESVGPLVEWLSSELSVDAPATPAEEIAVEAVAAQVAPDRQAVAGDAKKGAATYQMACASCHGERGAGGPVGPTLIARPVLHRSKDFTEVVRTGRQRMPAVPLDPSMVTDVIAFLRAQR